MNCKPSLKPFTLVIHRFLLLGMALSFYAPFNKKDVSSMEFGGDEFKTLSMDHHGLVVAICKDLKIAERIDNRIGQLHERRLVSTGKAVVAMILNGLGFTNRPLYLTRQFFENPIHAELPES